MKKIYSAFALLGIAAFMLSCTGSKQVRTDRTAVSGKWLLQKVEIKGIPLASQTKAELLNEADLSCFEGSTWSFNSINSLGSYSINKNAGECASLVRHIRWTVNEANGTIKTIQFKKVDDRYKDLEEGKAGYRFNILQLDANGMQWESQVNFEGRQASFIYHFVKQ